LNTNEKLIDALTRSETFQNYERAYSQTTGMPLALRPVEAWKLPFHGKRKESAFCALMAEKSRTCASCLQLQQELTQDAMNQPVTRTCAYGLYETAVPVKLAAQTIGFLQTGQAMRQIPTEVSFQRVVEVAAKRGVDIDSEQAKRAYLSAPVVSQKKHDAASSLLAIFADHLAIKCNQLVVQAANAEPPTITKARLFIRENCTEVLSLRQVSSSVNTSPFHFCKLFRKYTGVSFTEFVSRTRVENAKDLLLNPNLRISEVPFAVGFQSLAHFNRMFRWIVGQSPTDFRDKLPSPV